MGPHGNYRMSYANDVFTNLRHSEMLSLEYSLELQIATHWVTCFENKFHRIVVWAEKTPLDIASPIITGKPRCIKQVDLSPSVF